MTVEIPEPGHVHDDPLKKVDEKPATCTQEGSKAYYVCESCGTWFEDAAGEKAITDHDSVILPKTEHTPLTGKRTRTITGRNVLSVQRPSREPVGSQL